MSVKTVSRLVGALVAIAIVVLLYFLDRTTFPTPTLWWAAGFAGGAALLGLIASPYLTVVPYRWLRESSASDLLAAVVGLLIGLIVAIIPFALLSTLPHYLGNILSLLALIVSCFLGVTLAVQRKNDFAHLFQTIFNFNRRAREREREREEERDKERGKERDKLPSGPPQILPVTQILLDTSAI